MSLAPFGYGTLKSEFESFIQCNSVLADETHRVHKSGICRYGQCHIRQHFCYKVTQNERSSVHGCTNWDVSLTVQLNFCLQIGKGWQDFPRFPVPGDQVRRQLHAYDRGLPPQAVPHSRWGVSVRPARHFREPSLSSHEEAFVSDRLVLQIFMTLVIFNPCLFH